MKKLPHVIVEKRFIFRIDRSSPRPQINTKEMKSVRREIEAQYSKWLNKYMKKRGVIGPEDNPRASKPSLSKDNWQIEIGMKVPMIVHRRRAQWELFKRHAHPKSIMLKLFRMAEKEEYIKEGP